MLSKPHRKFCQALVSGLTGVRAYALAYPSCSLKTARFNASHLRAKPHVQQEIARMRAQADAIVGPTVLTLIEKRLWLARVVRANLAWLDPEIDGDLLVSLHVEEGRKQPRMSRMRITNKLAAIRLDSRLAGDEPPKPKESTSTPEKPFAGWGLIAPSGLVVPYEHCGWHQVSPATPPNPSPDTPSNESSAASADSQASVEPPASANQHESESSRDFPDMPPKARDFTFVPRPSPFDPSPSPPITSHEPPITTPPSPPSSATSPEPPIDNGYIAPVFYERPRFDPGADYYARMRAKRRQPVVRHLW